MNPSDDLEPLAHRLAAWKPAPVLSGRDRILYEAGVAAGRRQARRQMAAIVLPLLVGSTGWIWHERTERHRVELAMIAQSEPLPVQTLPATAPSPALDLEPPLAPGPSSYLVLSHRLASIGLDGLDPIEPRSESEVTGSRVRPMLTPLSSRGFQDLTEL